MDGFYDAVKAMLDMAFIRRRVVANLATLFLVFGRRDGHQQSIKGPLYVSFIGRQLITCGRVNGIQKSIECLLYITFIR